MSFRKRAELVLYSSGSGVAGKLVQFLGLTYLAVLFSPEQYARLAIAQVAFTGVAALLGSGLALAGNKSAASIRTFESSLPLINVIASVIRIYKLHLVVAAGLNVVLVPIVYTILAQEYPPGHVIVFGVLSSSVITMDLLVGCLAGAGNYKFSSMIDGVRGIGSGVFTVSIGIFASPSLAIYGLVVTDALLSAVTLVGILRTQKQTTLSSGGSESVTNLVGAAFVSSSLSQMTNWILVAVIQHSFGLNGVAIYSVANRFAALCLIIPGYLSKNVLGELARNIASGAVSERKSTVKFYLVSTTVFTFFSSVGALVAVKLVFTGLIDKYPDLMAVLAILLLGSSVRAVATALGVICVAQSQFKLWIYSDAAALIFFAIGAVMCDASGASLNWLLSIAAGGNLVALIARLGSLKWNIQQEKRLA